MLSISQALIATLIAAAVTFATRIIPFLFFSKRDPSPLIQYAQRYIPPMTMVILLLYCLKDIQWANVSNIATVFIPILITAALHIWRGNALISIFGGTALYMILIRLWGN
jgi:branched-subunit amino acid transport protein AzlD